ncbi:MAG: AraC family transcriptional regulator [Pandoraea sp.]|nr:AraC family transcriptional regulator [Pandoraea sp.]MDR3399547.1 AraC family transcriptional regulator [Pandoraea sp.]
MSASDFIEYPERGLSADENGEFASIVARKFKPPGVGIPSPLFPTVPEHSLATAMLKSEQLIATYLHGVTRDAGMSQTLPVSNAYVLSVQLKDSIGGELWKHGCHVPTDTYAKGSIFLGHLADEPTSYMPNEFECVVLMIPQLSLVEIGTVPTGELNTRLADVNHGEDPVLYHLAMALKAAMMDPGASGVQFIDHVSLAVCTHLCSAYGTGTATPMTRRRGLSRREERIAKALLTADLGIEPTLAAVAAACDLPVRQFVEAFRVTTGVPPFKWLRAYRVEMAKTLLLEMKLGLAEIAYACGFSDQSHFTRVFASTAGVTPAVWRRAQRA